MKVWFVAICGMLFTACCSTPVNVENLPQKIQQSKENEQKQQEWIKKQIAEVDAHVVDVLVHVGLEVDVFDGVAQLGIVFG